MISEYVLFDFPEGITRERVVKDMEEIAPFWRKNPDLIRKTFLYDPEANQGGALYLWKNREAAEKAHGEEWRQRLWDTYGCEPSIRYFETPLVADNALERIVSETEYSGGRQAG